MPFVCLTLEHNKRTKATQNGCPHLCVFLIHLCILKERLLHERKMLWAELKKLNLRQEYLERQKTRTKIEVFRIKWVQFVLHKEPLGYNKRSSITSL